MEMIIFIGIQASGKSTFYKETFFRTHVRINLDMLRTRHRERVLIEACLHAKQPLVIDNTNPTAAEREKYLALAHQFHFSASAYFFEPDYDESIARNQQREPSERIPIPGINSTLKKLEPPTQEEGYQAIYHVKGVQQQFFVKKMDTDNRL
ncbi:ATP-binding protein [Marininema halotolerans]|uniref:Predicted kinase n=1 Tax=Marininema halotolerans TaxID=1155944 RepID=A0A1I6NRQ9_9BACL|nr:ATP-binding protein [Marininema halotolerans]SFS30593.1 Predicted kinase [Marininema halotolerans]